jgi:hypothetical protein
VIAGIRDVDANPNLLPALVDQTVRFDFADATQFDHVLAGVDKVLLVRLPQQTDIALVLPIIRYTFVITN